MAAFTYNADYKSRLQLATKTLRKKVLIIERRRREWTLADSRQTPADPCAGFLFSSGKWAFSMCGGMCPGLVTLKENCSLPVLIGKSKRKFSAVSCELHALLWPEVFGPVIKLIWVMTFPAFPWVGKERSILKQGAGKAKTIATTNTG